MKKRILSLFIVLVMVIGLFPTVAFAASGFAGGSGTEGDPYLISTKEQLNLVRNDLAAHYKLTCDIVFSDSDFKSGGSFYNDGQGWTPIGSVYYISFIGSFDGNGHVIKNLHINLSIENKSVNVGLFGHNRGIIKNLGMVDSHISATVTKPVLTSSAHADVGGIVGYNCGGTVQECYNTGFISTNGCAGGIVGENDMGTIQNCYNTGSVSGGGDAGGIAGFSSRSSPDNSHGSSIQNCYNTGVISSSVVSSSSSSAGGIAGYSNVIVENCYNIGSVSASATSCPSYAGGMVGYNNGIIEKCYNNGSISATTTSSGSYVGGIAGSIFYNFIQECYNAGSVSSSSSSSYVGGIVGFNQTYIQNCYYLDIISKGVGDGTDSAVKCTAAQLKLQSTYTGFDFGSTWIMGGSECYSFAKLQDMEHIDHYFDNEQDYTCNCGYIDASRKFADVPAGAWFKQYVDYAIKNGIFSGTSQTTFSPNSNMTRAQFVQVLASVSGINTSNNNINTGFSDVPAGRWYTAAVAWAAENELVTGMGDGKFAPDATISREQMCVILVGYIEKYLGKSLESSADTPFADDAKIASWAKVAVYKCAKAGLISGVGNNKFDPQATATRAQGATIFKALHLNYILPESN